MARPMDKKEMAAEIRSVMGYKKLTREDVLELAGYEHTDTKLQLVSRAKSGDASWKVTCEILKAITE